MFRAGQGILGRIVFSDGHYPEYNRVYLIIRVFDEYIDVLNVSSVKGKERKLLFRSNMLLANYDPPFDKSSFVKLDSLTRVEISYITENCRLLRNGDTLANSELNQILQRLQSIK